jgi:hypothetical protein
LFASIAFTIGFQVIGFDQDEETESIEETLHTEGAIVVAFDPDITESWYRQADIHYTLLPATIPRRIPYNNPVTVHWMVRSPASFRNLAFVEHLPLNKPLNVILSEYMIEQSLGADSRAFNILYIVRHVAILHVNSKRFSLYALTRQL